MVSQSFESIGTEKRAKRVCVGILIVVLLGKESSIKMQVKRNAHQEYPLSALPSEKTCTELTAYSKNNVISYRSHFQAITHK